MKKQVSISIKTLIILICVLLLAGVAVYLYVRHQNAELEKLNLQKKTISDKVQTEATIIARKVDKQGLQHVTIEAAENIIPHAMINEPAVSTGILDTTAMAIGQQKKQIQVLTQISTTAQARALRAERIVDSLQRVTFYYKDRYLQLAYRPALINAKDSTDHGQFDFSYNDSLNVVQYWKKSWFLGAKKSYIDIYSNDKRTTVNGVKRLVVEQKHPTFGLRIQAVGNYSFSRKLLNFGPGIQFDFNRFSIVGSYYYDLDATRWRSNIGARYDIVRF